VTDNPNIGCLLALAVDSTLRQVAYGQLPVGWSHMPTADAHCYSDVSDAAQPVTEQQGDELSQPLSQGVAMEPCCH